MKCSKSQVWNQWALHFLGNKKSEEIGSGKTSEAKSYIQVVLSGHWHY